ncbi:MAG: M20/M25/M40 family metallo-hydrolase [Pirellulaceae bacterium]|nr:M20/M25/M40 family metallo-hydrolase [Pirellulaceae bacterium]
MILRLLGLSVFLYLFVATNELSAQFDFGEYREVVQTIIESGREKNESYDKLIELCDDVGHRISGSDGYNQAVAWALKTMIQDGHENVRSESTVVKPWIRGHESCELLEPRSLRLSMLGLGGSIATPPEGITGEVLVVSSKDELDQLPDEAVTGKIVLFNFPMPPYSETRGSGYGAAVAYRLNGAIWAAQRGAVAALVRSATAYSLDSPHTGTMRYLPNVPQIPSAAVTIEHAELLARFQARRIATQVCLKMEAHSGKEVESANVLGEIVGRELPKEIIVIGGHLDSWDVGQGAQDDGAGCVAAMEALTILRRLGLQPRRTIRVVLWTDEERGGAGAHHYAETHRQDVQVAGIESDSGGFTPKGLSMEMLDRDAESRAHERLRELLLLLAPLGRLEAKTGGSAADISKLKPFGTLCMGLNVDGRLYFNTHHTEADTVDKVNRDELNDCATMMAAVAYLLAELPGRLQD